MRTGRIDSPSTKLTGYIDGLIVANNATNPNTDVDFGTGVAWCVDRLIENTAAKTKILTGTWSAGNGTGGLFAGTVAANTWYHCFLLYNPTTRAIDFGFDTSVTAANKPSGWNARLIWSIKTNASSHIVQFAQRGDRCIWKNQVADAIVTYCPAATQLYTLSTPLGLNCDAVVSVFFSVTGSPYLYLANGDADPTPDYLIGRIDAQASVTPIAEKNLTTNTASQIQVSANVDTADCYLVIGTKSFLHPRGRTA